MAINIGDAYVRTEWTDNVTPVNADNMNNIENGIGEALTMLTTEGSIDGAILVDGTISMDKLNTSGSEEIIWKNTSVSPSTCTNTVDDNGWMTFHRPSSVTSGNYIGNTVPITGGYSTIATKTFRVDITNLNTYSIGGDTSHQMQICLKAPIQFAVGKSVVSFLSSQIEGSNSHYGTAYEIPAGQTRSFTYDMNNFDPDVLAKDTIISDWEANSESKLGIFIFFSLVAGEDFKVAVRITNPAKSLIGNNTIESKHIQDGAITKSKLDTELINGLGASLSKYTLYTVGDSLCTGGVWQNKIAELTGCAFDKEMNSNGSYPFSIGGSNSKMTNPTSTFFRTKNMIEHGGIAGQGENAIILFENVNDLDFDFDSTAKSYTLDKIINIDGLTTANLEAISVSDRTLGTVLAVNSSSAGKKLSITTAPTEEGDITLNVGYGAAGNRNYNIHVVPQDTQANTIAKVKELILEVDFVGMYDIDYDTNSVAFANIYGSSNITVEFIDTGKTGMVATITDITDAKVQSYRWYNSDDLSGWTTISNWVSPAESSGWKSSIESTIATYPKAHIAIVNLPRIEKTQADFLLPNGRYNESAFKSGIQQLQTDMTNGRKAIADLYNLKFIDVWGQLGISATNLTTFYQASSNVHPKTEGYNRYGEIVAGEISAWIAK